jgi:pyruvate/oxaloacetate carboxyltransferase
VRGGYGKTPIPVDPEFRKKITGSPEEVPYDTSNYVKPDNPILEDCGGVRLAETEKEMLLLELFPAVATKYLESKKRKMFDDEQKKIFDAEFKIREKEFTKILSGIEGNYQIAPEEYYAS